MLLAEGCDDVDFLEIMNFCGYDLDKAHEMAKEHEGTTFSEVIKRIRKNNSETERVINRGDDE